MIEKNIVNTWICYKLSNGEREELKTLDNTSEMTFSEDGRLTYRFMQENESQTDSLERLWKIDHRNEGDVLLINGEETYHIISLENGVLILESIKGDGFRHFYADKANFPTSEKQG